MNKFEIGEIAIYVRGPVPFIPVCPWFFDGRSGTECEIVSAAYLCKGVYIHQVKFSDSEIIARVYVNNLRKRPQQDDQLFTKWFNETILTDCAPSLEETMKTTQANLARYAQEGSSGQ